MKAMISQPMNGKTDEEILATRQRVEAILKEKGYDVVDSFFNDEWAEADKLKENGIVQIPVFFLSKSLEKMSECDAVCFCKGWSEYRGCTIEHQVASSYGLTVFYEE